MPVRIAVASGRFGVRSPSKYGTSTSPAGAGRGGRGPGGRARRGPRRAARAIASSTRAALSVATSGRKPPAASANPATVPVGSHRAPLGHGEDGAARADARRRRRPAAAPSPSAAARVVAGARARPRRPSGSLRPIRSASEHPRQRGVVARGPATEQLAVVAARRRDPSSRCRRHPTVGDELVEHRPALDSRRGRSRAAARSASRAAARRRRPGRRSRARRRAASAAW